MITAAQLRAARGMLDWTRQDLSKAASVSPETIKNIEHGTFRPQELTTNAIIRAFAAHHVEFTDDEGVRIVKDSVRRLEGVEGFRRFVDSVYETVKMQSADERAGSPICISNVDESLFAQYLGDYLPTHVQRMNEVKDLNVKVLVRNSVKSQQASDARGSVYRECREFPGDHKGNVPFYVYGDNLAVLIFDEKRDIQIVVISSPLVAKGYREQFEVMWNQAKHTITT